MLLTKCGVDLRNNKGECFGLVGHWASDLIWHGIYCENQSLNAHTHSHFSLFPMGSGD